MTEETQSDPTRQKSVRELSRSLQRCKGSYAFLVGAGTSRAAGIKTSNELVEKWISDEYISVQTSKDKEDWVEDLESQMADYQNRYGYWFEQRYTTREERRQFIKETVGEADPTFEHIVLSSLMSEEYVPITLTPNFDDLIYDAFYLYLEKRPFLVDHNAIAPQFKITHEDPMIVKLHGDYLYDNLKNTASETNELEENVKNVLKTTLNEYGLIVLGYSGRDESIMKVLNSDEIQIPDYGLYWCTTDVESLSPKVEELLEKDNTFLVEIDSSKEFFYELYDNLEELNVPTPVDIRERVNTRANQLEEDIIQVGGLDVLTVASEYNRRDEYDNALELLTDAIESGEKDPRIYQRRAWVFNKLGDYENAVNDYTKGIELCEVDNDQEIDYQPSENELEREEKKYSLISKRGIEHAQNGNYERAIDDLEECVDFEEDSPSAHANLAEVLILAGNESRGIEEAREASIQAENQRYEVHPQMLITIGRLLSGENYHNAKREYKELCEENFYGSWNFKEMENFLETKDLDTRLKAEIEHIMHIYHSCKTTGDDQQLHISPEAIASGKIIQS